MATKLSLGDTDQGKATSAIGAGLAVKWDTTAGNIVVCGVGDIPIGYTEEAIPAGTTGTFWRAGRGTRIYVSGSGISAGDYLKCGAAGVLVQEATPTTPTLFTVAQSRTASDSTNFVEATTTR